MSSFETSRSLSVQPLWNDFSRKSAAPHREERPRSGTAAAALDEYESLETQSGSVVNGSDWSLSPQRRVMDLVLAILGLLFFSPLFAALAIAVRFSSPGPVIFRQQRVGRMGQLFTIYKFRTMETQHQHRGLSVTRHGDRRITSLGRVLRRYKLDELPQLVNVMFGDMSLVGPRPKLPDHQHRQAQYMPFRPGITGAATLVFRCEEEMLRQIPEEQIEAFCKYKLTPYKTSLDYAYAERATFRSDVALMLRTAEVCVIRSKAKPPQPASIV
jgi:lipopolysaccharide/colanic/teichoic acid biosynthesis glycosyltransferase